MAGCGGGGGVDDTYSKCDAGMLVLLRFGGTSTSINAHLYVTLRSVQPRRLQISNGQQHNLISAPSPNVALAKFPRDFNACLCHGLPRANSY